MAQLDAADGEHAIDIEAGRPTNDCVVCMEPAEWVAVGPCGHREVCATCTVRMRFFDLNRRCCLCRAFCPTVVITKAGSTAGQQQARAQAAGAAQQVGRCLLYHGGVAAYFDNADQYEKAREMCLRLSSSPQGYTRTLPLVQWVASHSPIPYPNHTGMGLDNGLGYPLTGIQPHRHAPQHPDDHNWDWVPVLFCVVVNTLICLGTGLLFAMSEFQHWRHRILFTLGFSFIGGAFTYLFLSWSLHHEDRPESQ